MYVASLGADRKGMRRKAITKVGEECERKEVGRLSVDPATWLGWFWGPSCTECRPGQPEKKGCCSEGGSNPLRLAGTWFAFF